MKSFSILRTNTGLTTNVKVMVDSNYNLFLESINSTSELNISKYKKFSFNKENYYDELVPYFWNNLPTQLSYHIKHDNDEELMSNNFENQYDDLYSYGGRNISNNKNYKEEYEYFAPLYLNSELPSNFIIFRVDGIGLNRLSRINFKKEILSKFKTVKVFDLNKKTNIGFWLDRNFVNNKSLPITPFEANFKRLEFSKWHGIDYKSGGYTHRSRFLDDYLEKEREIFDFDRNIFDGYKNNSIIFPNILNLSFLFDDTPANSESLRKWSINRYYGFYLNSMDLVKSVSPVILPELNDDVKVLNGNVLSSISETPFKKGWDETKEYYVEYNNEYYKVEKYIDRYEKDIINTLPSSNNSFTDVLTETPVVAWKIISDLNLTGKSKSDLNKNTGKIVNKKLYDLNNNPIKIENFEVADIYLIEIDGVYHNLVKNNSNELEIISDWSFIFSTNTYSYYVNKLDSKWKKTVDFRPVIGEKPHKFNIWRLNFTDIKDFDTRIVDTEYSKFEYDYFDKIANTDETKMYFTNLDGNTYPPEFDTFNYKDQKDVHIPVSSEYIATGELFKIENNFLTPLWRKNPIYCRWVYDNSISANDQPYLLNNSSVFEKYNRTTNIHEKYVSRIDRNLDYFYTINPSNNEYSHHTLHVQDDYNTSFNFDFDFDIYKGIYGTHNNGTWKDLDYFTWFFKRRSHFNNGDIIKNSKKYSYFNRGDRNLPNNTLFRGIKFMISDIENVKLRDDDQIDVINTKNLNNYEDYKFSILMTSEDNGMEWVIVDEWKVGKNYMKDDLVRYDDMIFKCLSDNTYTNETSILNGIFYIQNSPFWDTNKWIVLQNEFPFWNPYFSQINPVTNNFGLTYYNSDLVYKDGEWWYYNKDGLIDFWSEINYKVDYCIYKGDIWMLNNGITNSHPIKPDSNSEVEINGKYEKYWSKLTEYEISNLSKKSKWVRVNLLDNSKKYPKYSTIISDNTIYRKIKDDNELDLDIKKSNSWDRIYSLNVDTDFKYDTTLNPYLFMNNTLYKLKSNPNNLTLDNGIRVFVNKKWKNVLINIYINDNTLPNIKNANRDLLYNRLYNKLVANNFINYINKITNKFDFSDTLKYIIIEKDYSIKEYDVSNIKGAKDLPIVYIDSIDSIFIKNNSIIKSPVYETNLKPFSKLIGNNISRFDQINYYNNGSMGISINENMNDSIVVDNYHGISNSVGNNIFRWSGNYSPLFYEVDIFRSNNVNEYYEVQIATSITVATFSYGTYSYTNFNDLINGLTSSISNDITFSYLKPDNKYRFYEFLSDDYKDKIVDYKDKIVLSIKFKSYDTNSENWIKIQSIVEGDSLKSKVIKRLVNNTPISNYENLNGNYKFDDNLTYFGIEREKIFGKVNRKDILLKLGDTVGAKSIYPMLDEFGYHFTDLFIFKSSWDFEYHIETNIFKPDVKTTTEKTVIDKIYKRNQEDIENLVFDFNSFGKVDDFLLNSYGKIYDRNETERKTAGTFPIKIESDSVEANPFRPKNTQNE
jgi:hypothetical protein